MRKEAKKYLSLYLLQHTKIQRLQGQIALYPQKAEQYRALIEDAEGLRREIEEKIEKTDGGLLSEILYLKYVLGKTLPEISFTINYSQRQTERLHRLALDKFSALQGEENGLLYLLNKCSVRCEKWKTE